MTLHFVPIFIILRHLIFSTSGFFASDFISAMGDNASEKDASIESLVERVKNELEAKSAPDSSEKPKKVRKAFEWTDKRLEAFKKMREGLVTKNEITKELKAEKKKSEKDEIKKRIRDLMSHSSASKKVASASANVSDESSSDAEVVAITAKSNREKGKEEKVAKVKSKRVRVPEPSSGSSEEEGKASSSEEEEKVLMTKKQYQKLLQGKQSNGKAPRNAKVFNAMDNFILL